MKQGEITADFFYALIIDRLEPGDGGKFVFFAEHQTEQFAILTFPKEGTAQSADRHDAVKLAIADPAGPSHVFSPHWDKWPGRASPQAEEPSPPIATRR